MGIYRATKLSVFWKDFCHHSNTARIIVKSKVEIPGESSDIPVMIFIGTILCILTNQGIGIGRSGAFMADEDKYQAMVFARWESRLLLAQPEIYKYLEI